MSEDQLFDYDVKPKRAPRKTNQKQELIPRPPGYHLLTNSHGVQGFHRTKIPEAAMARHGSCVSLCGITGRRLGDYPKMVALCEACEVEHRKGKG